MATVLKNLSDHSISDLPDCSKYKFGIVVAEWNTEVTSALLEGAVEVLKAKGIIDDNLSVVTVPGTFELALGAQKLAEQAAIDAVITLGCVIQGETRHFDFICDAAANGIMQVGLKYNKPVIFGVLTTENQEQALDRAGGKHGNKGVEAAVTAIKMLNL